MVKAALRPTMRFVAVKTEDQQARAMLFRTRLMFVGQRTQMINAVRGHPAVHGSVAATGTAQLKRLADAIEDPATALSEGVRDLGQMHLMQIAGLNARVAELDLKMSSAAKEAEVARRVLDPAEHDFDGPWARYHSPDCRSALFELGGHFAEDHWAEIPDGDIFWEDRALY